MPLIVYRDKSWIGGESTAAVLAFRNTRRYLQHAHFSPTVGVERGAYQVVHGNAKAAPVTGITLTFTGPGPADSRQ